MAEVVLSAEEHFERLREAVWARFCARHRASDRDRFDDLYAEWWAREVERAARGVPSRAAAPAAFIAEAVHRVMIDDARARARGLGRDAKGSLELVDLDDHRAVAGTADTAQAAGYEALVHRVLTLVTERLTPRETRVFVFSFLYLQPSDAVAQALGLSLPRVKKDRKRIAAKVGAEVWAVLSGELDLCAVYDEKALPAVFEILTVHVEDCPVCRAALGGVRRGALAVLGPELVVVEDATHAVSDAIQGLAARWHGLAHRGTEALIALPPSGRTAAAVAVAATAVAGGAASVVPELRQQPRRARPVVRSTPTPAAARAVVARRPHPVATATPAHHAKAVRPQPQPIVVSTPAPPRAPAAFEQARTPAPARTTARTASVTTASSATTKEFGFEQP